MATNTNPIRLQYTASEGSKFHFCSSFELPNYPVRFACHSCHRYLQTGLTIILHFPQCHQPAREFGGDICAVRASYKPNPADWGAAIFMYSVCPTAQQSRHPFRRHKNTSSLSSSVQQALVSRWSEEWYYHKGLWFAQVAKCVPSDSRTTTIMYTACELLSNITRIDIVRINIPTLHERSLYPLFTMHTSLPMS